MGFSRQEHWSGLSFPSPGDRPDPGIKLGSSALQADALLSEPTGNPSFQGNGLMIKTQEGGILTSLTGKKIKSPEHSQ